MTMYATYEKQAAARRARYEKRKAAHLCVNCGKADERTEKGRARCEACYKKNKARQAEYQKMLRKERAAWGVCTECGKTDAFTMSGRKLCSECAEKECVRERKRRGSKEREEKKKEIPEIPWWERPSYGMCSYCGAPLANRSKSNGERVRVCEQCWQRARRNVDIALAAKRAAKLNQRIGDGNAKESKKAEGQPAEETGVGG